MSTVGSHAQRLTGGHVRTYGPSSPPPVPVRYISTSTGTHHNLLTLQTFFKTKRDDVYRVSYGSDTRTDRLPDRTTGERRDGGRPPRGASDLFPVTDPYSIDDQLHELPSTYFRRLSVYLGTITDLPGEAQVVRSEDTMDDVEVHGPVEAVGSGVRVDVHRLSLRT